MLSVTIITLNEEENLARCLESVKNLADEIIVVDSGSTDKTLEIAEKYKTKIFHRDFDNYSNQKNYAASKATEDWVLSVDADEIIEKELAREIESRIPTSLKLRGAGMYQVSGVDGYSIPRKNIIFGKFIKYTRWQPELDRHIWLWKKGKGKWNGDVHEEVIVNGKIGKMKYAKVHFQYETVREFLDMINKYSEIEAQEKVQSNVSFSYTKLFLQSVYNFIVRFFYRLGFLDGIYGFILSFLMAFYHFILWIKIWNLKNQT